MTKRTRTTSRYRVVALVRVSMIVEADDEIDAEIKTYDKLSRWMCHFPPDLVYSTNYSITQENSDEQHR